MLRSNPDVDPATIPKSLPRNMCSIEDFEESVEASARELVRKDAKRAITRLGINATSTTFYLHMPFMSENYLIVYRVYDAARLSKAAQDLMIQKFQGRIDKRLSEKTGGVVSNQEHLIFQSQELEDIIEGSNRKCLFAIYQVPLQILTMIVKPEPA
jgi:hypothetical protein